MAVMQLIINISAACCICNPTRNIILTTTKICYFIFYAQYKIDYVEPNENGFIQQKESLVVESFVFLVRF